MTDQAQGLREMISASQGQQAKQTRIITITSGKGGVGKSNFTLNFALVLQSMGHRVLIFDADIGLANLDVLLGIRPQYTLYHLLKRERTLSEIICTGPYGLQLIAGGSGFGDLMNLSEEDLDYFTHEVSKLQGHVDFILFDTGAGLAKETLKFILAAQETVVVTTPEPTAITDAYAIIKMVHAMQEEVKFQLVVNRASDRNEGRQTADKITFVARKFLDLDIPVLGYVADDTSVTKAVKKQNPFTLAYPNSRAAVDIKDIAQRFVGGRVTEPQETGISRFIRRMTRFLPK